MTTDISSLNQVTLFNGSEKIKIGNGQGLTIKSMGSTLIETPSHYLILKNVLRVPSIAVNSLYVTQLWKNNKCWFIYDYA